MAFVPILSLSAAGASPGTRRGGPATFTPPRRRPGVVARAAGAIRDIYALARHADARRPEREADAAIVEARLLASQWQGRAECAERRIAELERHLASSEMTALELRSRVVCLHGKLATSAATARYQVMTRALEGRIPRPTGDRAPTRDHSRI